MQKGQINVKTENIFPIIKKFLYSDHEIFLRELISNAVDATQKLNILSSRGNVKGDLGNLTIEVLLDKEAKTLTIRDKGIGMTSEEVDNYINQIAFSSAEEFLAKYKGKSEADTSNIIGHFGLGFYSSFMVSSKVEIITKTYKKGAGTKAVRWECDGSPEYHLEESDKKTRGTDIVLHIADDSVEFLEESRIHGILNKYCKFLPVPIEFGTEKIYEKVEGEKDEQGNDKTVEVEKPRIINNTDPLWKKKPADLKDEDYKAFYRELYPMTFDEPLFHIHLNVDYPFNLTGILYFPKVKKNIEVQKDKIQLFSNQVFVTESVEDIVPDFLTLLHGVLDSPDIPLNVSRSFLQSDSNVKKISNHIMKKVTDKLEEIFKNNREEFEKKWEDIKVFIQYGIISEEKFYERAKNISLFHNIDDKFFTFEEYENHIKANQTDKDKKLVYLYTTDEEAQHAFIEPLKERGYDILKMDGTLDNHYINFIEQKLENTKFLRVDAETIEKIISKEDDVPSKLDDKEKEKLKEIFEDSIEKEKFSISFESLSQDEMPVLITRPEFMRRMKDMANLGGSGMDYMMNMPESLNLVVNTNHDMSSRILKMEKKEERTELIKQVVDLALLAQGMLKGKSLTEFVKRSVSII